MDHVVTQDRTTIPFLTRYASERTDSPEIQGHYSADLAMWVIVEDGVEIPLIDHSCSTAELTTKTRVQQESDDEESSLVVAELVTKTDAGPEQDDESF